MKILQSNIFLFPKKVGGAENYIYNLLDGFKKIGFDKQIDLVVNENVVHECDEIVQAYAHIKVDVKHNRGVYDYFLKYFVKNIGQYNIVFSPNYITPFLFTKKIKRVTTIYDVQYLHYPEFFSKKKRLWQYLSHLITLYRSDKVICISENVKDDLIHYFGKRFRKKIEVIYIPIDFSRFEQSEKCNEVSINSKYILSVAAQYPHKNLLTLVKAFNKLNNEAGYKLVLAGQLGENLIGKYKKYHLELTQEIEKNKDNIIVTGYVSNECLGYLYKNCDLFVFPSLFEGFGMPPVEAMGFGKPVITTKCASLKEVTMGDALYVENPEDDNELKVLMEQTLNDIDKYNQVFDKTKDKIKAKYNPEGIAKEYKQMFLKV